jgi:hypothetical protein
MPFGKRARIEVENQHWEEMRAFFYQFDYSLTDVPDDVAYFHAQWRRSLATRDNPEHVMRTCGSPFRRLAGGAMGHFNR